MATVNPQGSLLVSVPNVELVHLLSGETTALAKGTLQLTSVNVQVDQPTTSAVTLNDTKTVSSTGVPPPIPARPSTTNQPTTSSSSSSTTDQFLLMTLSVEGDTEPIFEMVLPATSRIITQPPSSYIIPNSQEATTNEDGDGAGFIKVILPSDVASDARELFEHVLWGMTSFSSNQLPSYAESALRSQLVLVDNNGDVVGTLAGGVSLHEDSALAQEGQGEKEKEPVVVEATSLTTTTGSSTTGSHFDFNVRPLSAFTSTPNPSNSSIITLGDYVSHGLIVGADMIARTLEYGADTYVQKRPSTSKPLVFSQSTKAKAEKGQVYSGQVVKVSGKAAKMVGDAAAKVGDRIGKATGVQTSPSGKPPTGLKGLVNKSLIAFNTVLDAAEVSAKTLLDTGGSSTSKVINHSYGSDAAKVSGAVGSGAQNVFLVYLDARGVSRKALLKGVGKGALRCKMQDGREVLLTDDEGKIQPGSGANTPGTVTPPQQQIAALGEKGKVSEKSRIA